MSSLHSALSPITVAALLRRSNTLQLKGSFYIINSRSSVKVEVSLYRFVLVSTLLISSRPHIFLLCPRVLSSGDVCSGEMLGLFLLSPSLCLYLFKWVGNIFSRRYSLKSVRKTTLQANTFSILWLTVPPHDTSSMWNWKKMTAGVLLVTVMSQVIAVSNYSQLTLWRRNFTFKF